MQKQDIDRPNTLENVTWLVSFIQLIDQPTKAKSREIQSKQDIDPAFREGNEDEKPTACAP